MLNTSTTSSLFVDAEMSSEKKDAIGKALGRLASGVFIVTASDDGLPTGMLATWVCQASFHPPMVSIAINKERGILAALKPGSALTVNVLAKNNNDIFKAFAKPQEPGVDRFSELPLTDTQNNCPAFAAAVSYLECQVQALAEAGDHVIALAQVLHGQLLNADAEPMVHLRKNGFQY